MTDLGVKNALSREGWHLSEEGYATCLGTCADGTESSAPPHEIALNQDLRKIGGHYLPNSITRGVTQEVKGPLILQIQKITNIAVPTYHQHDGSGGGSRLLKLQLTDGHIYCNALELKHTPQLNLNIPPGTKLKIMANVMARNGFLLLTPAVVKVLGGHVDHMVEKWKASKAVVAERSKVTGNVVDGPPPFVPFSQAASKRQHPAKPTEQSRGSGTSAAPQKHNNQARQDVKMSAKQTDKSKPHHHHQDKAFEATPHRQTGSKPHHHQRQPFHQHDRFQDRSFQGHPSKQRPHNPQYRRPKGHANDRSQGQASSELLPVAFNSSEEHFPALSHQTNHPQPRFTSADDKQHQPFHKPMLAWDSQTSNTTTGGSVPFGAKRKT